MFVSASLIRGTGGSVNLYDSLRNQSGGGAALVESFQAQLKQRDGELVQIQMELGAMERAKENMSGEVNRLSQKVEGMDRTETEMERLKKAFVETEQKYQTMLTMYGEKVEEAEELRLDLGDVKEMYKNQIEELMMNDAK
jgi:chromosome segregation ATPase